MSKQKFRDSVNPREALAIDPKAFDLMFAVGGAAETQVTDAGVAIVSICGPLEHHHSFIWDSYDDILERIETALSDEEVRAIALCIDSPGGDAAGATESHKKIRKLKAQYGKPVFAYSNEAMFSAAYALGSAADEIWLPSSGGVGSIGVIAALVDRTKANQKAGVDIQLITTGARKADTHSDRPLTDDVIDSMQSRVDHLGKMFFGAVAGSRGLSPEYVASLEAGVFLGRDAVKVGLADGIAGWDKFLEIVSSSLNNPLDTRTAKRSMQLSDRADSSKGRAHMKTVLQLTKARDEALTAFAAATSEAAKKKLLATYRRAESALAQAQLSSKTKYKKTTEEEETDESEEDDADEESEDEEEDEESKKMKKSEEDSEDEEEESDEDDEDDDDDSSADTTDADEKAMSLLGAKSGLHTAQRLYRLCCQVTGKRDLREVFGALDAMGHRIKSTEKVEKRMAKLETENRRAKVDSLLAKARSEGRIASSRQLEQLQAMGMKDVRQLKGFLSSMPKGRIRTVEEGGLMADEHGRPSPISVQGLDRDQRKMLEQAAADSGKTVEEFAAEVNKRMGAKLNGSAPKF